MTRLTTSFAAVACVAFAANSAWADGMVIPRQPLPSSAKTAYAATGYVQPVSHYNNYGNRAICGPYGCQPQPGCRLVQKQMCVPGYGCGVFTVRQCPTGVTPANYQQFTPTAPNCWNGQCFPNTTVPQRFPQQFNPQWNPNSNFFPAAPSVEKQSLPEPSNQIVADNAKSTIG